MSSQVETEKKSCSVFEQKLCAHCYSPILDEQRCQSQGEEYHFCCPGCRAVFQWLSEKNLADYYDRRGLDPSTAIDDLRLEEHPERWSLPQIYQRYGTREGDGTWFRLSLEGMHCPACVWLIESVLAEDPAVKKVKVNLTFGWIDCLIQDDKGQLGDVVQTLAQLGYVARPLDPDVQKRQAEVDYFLGMLGVAGFCAGNGMLAATSLYLGFFQGMEPQFQQFFSWLSAIFATVSILVPGQVFLRSAYLGLRSKTWTMDSIVSLGLIAAYCYSLVQLFSKGDSLYFDTVSMLVFTLLVGRYFESRERQKVVSLFEHLRSRPPMTVKAKVGDNYEEVPCETVAIGDIVAYETGDTVSADVLVLKGEVEYEQSLFTGEFTPQYGSVGTRLYQGMKVLDGWFSAEVLAVGSDSILGRIQNSVEDTLAQARPKAMWQKWVGRFIVFVLVLAVISWFYWSKTSVDIAWKVALSTVIITCPCALGLAIPLVMWVAIGRALKKGVLVRSADSFEHLMTAKNWIFDKTGTLTTGECLVKGVTSSVDDSDWWVQQAAILEKTSLHPVALGIVKYAAQRGLSLEGSVEVQEDYLGCGRHGKVNGHDVLVGKSQWVFDKVNYTNPLSQTENDIHLAVAIESQYYGSIYLDDTPRVEAEDVLCFFQGQDKNIILYSGDESSRVEALAKQYAIDESLGEMSPEDKVNSIRQLQNQGEGCVFVGDGMNDAQSLAEAQVGVAVNGAALVSLTAADLILLDSKLDGLIEVWKFARWVHQKTRENLTLALVYNILAIPAALMGWVEPLVAAVAMPVSSLVLLWNTLRNSP